MPLEGNVFFLYWPMLSMPEYIHIVQLKQEKKKSLKVTTAKES